MPKPHQRKTFGDMMTYFRQIIFPPLLKPSHVTERYGIDNTVLGSATEIKVYKPILQDKSVDFWFVDVFDLVTKISKLQLVAACPVCDTSFIMRHDVPNKEIMRRALVENKKFYISYVRDHCPYCCPGNAITDIY